MSDVFVSYSRRDSELVARLVGGLETRGKSVWLDTEAIRGGEVFPEAIRTAIEQADAFVFVISPHSVESAYCQTEVDHAAKLHKRIVPVLLEPVPDEKLPDVIRVRHWIELPRDGDITAALDRVVDAIDTDLDHLHSHTKWLVKALEWDAERRESSFLLRGQELASADAWLEGVGDKAEPAPTALQREYVYSSRRASSRRQRSLVAGSGAVTTISVALLIFALISRSQALTAQSQATSEALQSKSRVWAAESNAQLPVDPERSILLAIAAAKKSPTADAAFALRRALDVSPLRVRLPDVGVQSTIYWGAGISYSPDGTRIAEGSQNGSVYIFDARTGQQVNKFAIGEPSPIVQYSPNGAQLAVATQKGVELLDAATGSQLQAADLLGYAPATVTNFAFTRDGSAVYFADGANVVRWDIRAKAVKYLATSPIGDVGTAGLFFADLSPDGTTLYVAGWPGVAALDAASGAILATNATIQTIWWMVLSPDGSQLAVTNSPPAPSFGVAGELDLLDAHTLQLKRVLGPHLDADTYTALAFSPDGSRLAFGANEGSAGVFDLRTGNELISFPGHITNIYQVEFSPDGGQVVTAAGDGKAYVWRATGNQLRSIAADGFNETASGWVNADLFFQTGQIIARYGPTSGPHAGDQVIQTWGADGKTASQLSIASASSFVRLSSGGRIAIAGPLPPSTIIDGLDVWNVDQGQATGHLAVTAQCCPALSEDGHWMAFPNGTDNTELDLADLSTNTVRKFATGNCPWGYFDFSHDAQLLAATNLCGDLDIWQLQSGALLGHPIHFVGFINLGPIRFSADARLLAVANSGNVGQVTVIDVVSRLTLATLTGDVKGIQDVAFSPDGDLLATASVDGTARIWDAHTGQPLRILDDPTAVDNVAFSADGSEVATLDYAGVINVWDACTDCRNIPALLKLAEQRVTRQLTPAETSAFLS